MGYDSGDSFPFDLNQMEIHLVQDRKENCHHDHIPFNVKENGNIVPCPNHRVLGGLWVYTVKQNNQQDVFNARYVAKAFLQIPDLDYRSFRLVVRSLFVFCK